MENRLLIARSLGKKVWEKDGYSYKRAIEVILVGMELSVLCLYQCQYPAGDCSSSRRCHWGKLGKADPESLNYFLQLLVNLQSSPPTFFK